RNPRHPLVADIRHSISTVLRIGIDVDLPAEHFRVELARRRGIGRRQVDPRRLVRDCSFCFCHSLPPHASGRRNERHPGKIGVLGRSLFCTLPREAISRELGPLARASRSVDVLTAAYLPRTMAAARRYIGGRRRGGGTVNRGPLVAAIAGLVTATSSIVTASVASAAGLSSSISGITTVSPCAGQNAEVLQAVDTRIGYVYESWMGCKGIAFARSLDGGK